MSLYIPPESGIYPSNYYEQSEKPFVPHKSSNNATPSSEVVTHLDLSTQDPGCINGCLSDCTSGISSCLSDCATGIGGCLSGIGGCLSDCTSGISSCLSDCATGTRGCLSDCATGIGGCLSDCTSGFAKVFLDTVKTVKTSTYECFGWTNSIEDAASIECLRLKGEIRILEQQIKKFDDFILSQQDLEKICREHINKYSHYINFNINPPPEDLDPNNVIDRMTRLGIELNHLKHFWQERVEFIERHQSVMESFSKHVQESFLNKDLETRTNHLFLENTKKE